VILRFALALPGLVALATAAAAQECPAPGPTIAPAPPAATAIAIRGPEELPIEVTSGAAEVSRQGDAILSGGVVVRQGDQQLSAESAAYEARTGAFKVEGDVEFTAPELRIKGSTGSWSVAGGGSFSGAEFALPARPARGAAADLRLRPDGALQLREGVLVLTDYLGRPRASAR
jgi:hypothetical protein